MNYFLFLEYSGGSAEDDLGIALLLVATVLLLVAFICLIWGLAKKNMKMFKITAIAFIAAGISALVGLGQCGWL